MRRTPDEACDLLEDMALNAFNWQSERSIRRPIGVHSIDSYSSLAAQMETLQQRMDRMNVFTMENQGVSYEYYREDHDSVDCQVS